MGEPNSRYGGHGHQPMEPDATLPPELDALAQRLNADGAVWQSRLPDPSRVAERIRAIPLTTPRTLDERGSLMTTQVSPPPEHGQRTRRPDGRPPRLGPQRGLLAALAAVLIVGFFAVVLVQLVHQRGTSTSPIGQPTQTQTQPTPTLAPTAIPTASPTPSPTPAGTWTTVQGFTGSGNYKTASFQVTSPWRLVWQCNLSMGNPGPYPLQVAVSPSAGSGGTTGVIDTTCKTGNTRGTSAEQTAPTGLVYLSVTSAADGEWDLRVQVLR